MGPDATLEVLRAGLQEAERVRLASASLATWPEAAANEGPTGFVAPSQEAGRVRVRCETELFESIQDGSLIWVPYTEPSGDARVLRAARQCQSVVMLTGPQATLERYSVAERPVTVPPLGRVEFLLTPLMPGPTKAMVAVCTKVDPRGDEGTCEGCRLAFLATLRARTAHAQMGLRLPGAAV